MAKYMDSKVFVGVIVAILLLAVGSVSGATITVDDSGGTDYLSIQAAINNASGSETDGGGGGGSTEGWNSTQVTNDIYSDQEPVIIKRSNGELFITFNSGGEDRIAGLYSTVSINNGTNWSVPRFAINGWGGLGLIEDANGRLISLVNDAGIYSWISSDDGQTWNNKRKVTPTSVNYEAGSIIQAQNGYYYVSYSNAYPGDVYTTRSLDLSTWENPVQVSTGNDCEFDSSLLQASDGIFYLAYNSYTDDAIVIAISNDGQTWDTMHKIPTSVDAHKSVNLIELESKPVLFYGSQGILYYSFLDGSTWDSPQEIFSPSPFGADAVLLEDGSVGIAYANDGSQRDIFFTNLGKLNLLSSKPGPTITFSSRSQYEDDSESFTATVDQVADVTWILDGVTLYTNTSVTTASYYNSSAQLGIHNLTVIAENANGTDQKKLTWYVGGANFVLRTGGTKELYEGYSLIVDQIDVDGNKMWFTIEKDGVEVGSRILNSGDSFSYSRTIDGSSHLILQGSLKEVFEGTDGSYGLIDNFYQFSEIDGSVLIDDSNDIKITLSPPSSISNNEGDSATFIVTVDQVANVTWILDGVTLYTNTSVTTASYYNSSAQLGIHNLTVIAESANGTCQRMWTWGVGGASFTLRLGETRKLYEGYSLTVEQIDIASNSLSLAIEKDGFEFMVWILEPGHSFSYSRTIDGSSHLILQGSLEEVFEGMLNSIGVIDHFYQLSEIDGSVLIGDPNYFPKPGPTITHSSPSSSSVSNNEGDSETFTATVDQVANVTWILDGVTLYTNTSVTTASYYNSSAQLGNHNLIVIAENVNGACERRWTWIVEESISSETGANTLYIRGSVFNGSDITNNDMGYIGNNGNGILEINASNFAGFHYDLNSNIGAEKFEILQNSTESYRTINENGLVYTTSIIDANYEQTLWTDQYQKICYFGEEYVPIKSNAANKLSKLLIDEKDSHIIREEQSLELGEGYAITPKIIDIEGNTVRLELTKNGEYVDDKIIKTIYNDENNTWSYDQDMGGETDVVTLRIYVDQVFQGQIDSLVVIKGIWQISDLILELDTNTTTGLMEIQEIDSKIKMVNKRSMILHRGSTVDLANNVSIVVADSNDIRFHLSKGYTTPGVYEVRGEAHNLSSGTYGIIDYNNFAGFYYDLDANIGTESLEIRSISDRTISANSLVYTTVPKVAEFEYTPFGTYDVIGFMGDEYFAGYPAGTFGISTPISMISDGQLSQVLIDEDKNHAIYSGAGLILEEGYVLNIVEFDTDLEKIFVTLTKDGSELDSSVISSDTNYVYKKDLGSSDDIPIIAVHFGNIFQGTETNAVFVDGIFQISEWYMAINNGDPYGEMHVVNVDSTKIEMKNDDSILLRNDSTIYVMDKIYFKVADDSNNVRFYPFTEVMIEFIDDDEPIEEESYLYTMQLQKGWNLVSTPLIPDTPDVNTLFDSNNDVILPVYSWNTANKQYYNVNTIEISKGYWILALNDTQVTFAGTQYSGGMGAI